MAGFVEALRQSHGLLDTVTEAGARRLLQGRGRKWGRRPGLGWAVLAFRDAKPGGPQPLDEPLRLAATRGAVTAPADFANLESGAFTAILGEVGVQGPVFLRSEGADFLFPLDDQLHGHRLHPARGQAPGDLFP